MQTSNRSGGRFGVALCPPFTRIPALWTMTRETQGEVVHVGQFSRSDIDSRAAGSGMIPMLLDRMASLLRVLSAGALLGCASLAVAEPITTVSQLSLRRNEDGMSFQHLGVKDQILLTIDSVIPNGYQGTTITAQTTNSSTGLLIPPIAVPFIPSTVLPNNFSLTVPYDPNLTDPWTVTITNNVNTADSLTLLTQSIVGVPPAPFAYNTTVSGSSLNPTLSWSYPSSVDAVLVLIFDKTKLIPGLNLPDNVFGQSVSGATNSYTLAYTLDPSHSYIIGFVARILRDPTQPDFNANCAAQSETYVDFAPTGTGPLPGVLYLPTIGPNGVYNFNLTAQPNTTYYIDPNVATGFTYTIGAGNPNFATVVLPALQGSEPYTISWDDGLHSEQVLGGKIFNFLATDPLGVSTFTVRGIDPADGVDPRSGTGFVTGLTFVSSGSFTGTMMPLTTVYITNEGSHTVSVIDPSTNTVVDTVRVGSNPAQAVLTPNGTTAYVLNTGAGTVSVINTPTNSVIATIRVGLLPAHATVTPDGSSVYVVNTGSNSISVISTATQSVVATIPVGLAPIGLAITPDGSRAYVTNAGSENVSVINTATHTVSAVVQVGAFPLTLALTPDGTRAYVVNSGSNSVSVVNTGTNTVETTVQVGRDPVDVAINPNGASAYVADAFSHSVTILNTATNQVVTTIPVGFLPVKTAITPNGRTAYVADAGGKSVSAINTATNTVIATIGVGAEPVDVLISPDGVHAYVTDAGSNSVSVIDTSTNAVSATVPVGVRPVNGAIF
jgi:YVTN family beta-propeller protein